MLQPDVDNVYVYAQSSVTNEFYGGFYFYFRFSSNYRQQEEKISYAFHLQTNRNNNDEQFYTLTIVPSFVSHGWNDHQFYKRKRDNFQ